MYSIMSETASEARCGVILCECGSEIASKVDLAALAKLLHNPAPINHVEILPFPCLAPGLEIIKEAIEQKGLNRLVIAGCEHRINLKRFERELEGSGLEEGQIDMVNLRGHVAQVHTSTPADLALKGAKLIKASLAGLQALVPYSKVKVEVKGPVMVLGGGIATYSAAQELLRRGVASIIAVHHDNPEEEINLLHEHYPGERSYFDRLRQIMREVEESSLVTKISAGEVEKIMGRFGEYTVTFGNGDKQSLRNYQVGAIIAAFDAEIIHQSPEFGHHKTRILCQSEMEEFLRVNGIPEHQVVFWINDLETDRPYGQLSARSAWGMASYMREKMVQSRVSILYNNKIPLPLSTSERIKARELGIPWIPYNGNIRPMVQDGYITYCQPDSQIEQELAWSQLVLSPRRGVSPDVTRTAKIMGQNVVEGGFLGKYPQMVRPDQVGLDEKVVMAGSALVPCDLREALRQGRRAANKIATLVTQAKEGRLFAPRDVCTVDQSRCTGCGLCREICDCGGIQPVEGVGGHIPRSVDPMVCTGDGTCAAACPHLALTLQNNTSTQQEAKVGALARRLAKNEVLGFGCSWSGTATADHAGLQRMTYSPRFYLLPIRCIGQVDPRVMGRAFLEGANALLLVGCGPEECHHSYGLDHTWSRVLLLKKLLSLCGLERERIALAHSDLSRPEQFVRTVGSFLAAMDRLGPIDRDDATQAKLKDLYDTLHNPRVRWVLGVSLRRPGETSYPADQRNAMDYDMALTDVITEEFFRTRITNYLSACRGFCRLEEIAQPLNMGRQRVSDCLKDLADEGLLSCIFKDRTPYYSLR